MNARARGTEISGLRRRARLSSAVLLPALAGSAAAVRVSLGLSPRFLVAAIFFFAAVILLAMAGLRAHHPYDRLGPANLITGVRAALVALLAGFLAEPPLARLAWPIVAMALVAAVLDGADGWLARRSGMGSAFGARFDLETDALLILVLSLLAWRYGKAGSWIVLAGLLRYLFVAAGAIWRWMRRPLPASR